MDEELKPVYHMTGTTIPALHCVECGAIMSAGNVADWRQLDENHNAPLCGECVKVLALRQMYGRIEPIEAASMLATMERKALLILSETGSGYAVMYLNPKMARAMEIGARGILSTLQAGQRAALDNNLKIHPVDLTNLLDTLINPQPDEDEEIHICDGCEQPIDPADPHVRVMGIVAHRDAGCIVEAIREKGGG